MVAKIAAWKRHKVEYILKIIIAIILGFFIYVYMLASMAYAWEHNKYSLYFYAALFLIVLAWEKSDIIKNAAYNGAILATFTFIVLYVADLILTFLT